MNNSELSQKRLDLENLISFSQKAKDLDIEFLRHLAVYFSKTDIPVTELARKLGVSRGFIYKWKNREFTTGLKTLHRSGRPRKQVNLAFAEGVKKAAEEQGVHPSTIYRAIYRQYN